MIEKIIILGLLASLLGAVLISFILIRRDGPEESIPFLLGVIIFRFFMVTVCIGIAVIIGVIISLPMAIVGGAWLFYALLLAPPKLVYLDNGIVGQVSYFEAWLSRHRRVKQEMRETLATSRARR